MISACCRLFSPVCASRTRCCSARGLRADWRDKLLKMLDTGVKIARRTTFGDRRVVPEDHAPLQREPRDRLG